MIMIMMKKQLFMLRECSPFFARYSFSVLLLRYTQLFVLQEFSQFARYSCILCVIFCDEIWRTIVCAMGIFTLVKQWLVVAFTDFFCTGCCLTWICPKCTWNMNIFVRWIGLIKWNKIVDIITIWQCWIYQQILICEQKVSLVITLHILIILLMKIND